MIVKNLNFGNEARDKVFEGIEKLTQAVSSTLGASGKCVILEDSNGNPIITKDGVTVAENIILRNPVENMGATLLKQAAKTAGALGTSISGSGPSIFSLCQGIDIAKKISSAQKKVLNSTDVSFEVYISKINTKGVSIL